MPVIQTVFSPGMVAWFLAGRDTALLSGLMRDEPALMAAGLERLAVELARFTEDSLAAGAAGVFYAINPLADTTVVPPDVYDALYLPSDRIAAAAAAEAGSTCSTSAAATSTSGSLASWACTASTGPSRSPATRGWRSCATAWLGGRRRCGPLQPDPLRGPERDAQGSRSRSRRHRRPGHLLTPGCSSSPWDRVRPENLRALAAAAG